MAYFWKGDWYIRRSENGFEYSIFSNDPSGFRLSPGDYDGDGKFDAAYFIVSNHRGFNWHIQKSSISATIFEAATLTFGISNDVSVPNAFTRAP